MVFQRIISRLPGRTLIFGQPQTLKASRSKLFSQITQKCDLFSGSSVNYGARFLGNLGSKFYVSSSLKFASFIHSVDPSEVEKGMDNGPVETQKFFESFEGLSRRLGDVNTNIGRSRGYFEGLSRRLTNNETGSSDTRPFRRDVEFGRNNRSMNFVNGVMNDNRNDNRSGLEHNADIVHIKIMRNNTFVTVTDSKGNKKTGASAGCLAEMKKGGRFLNIQLKRLLNMWDELPEVWD